MKCSKCEFEKLSGGTKKYHFSKINRRLCNCVNIISNVLVQLDSPLLRNLLSKQPKKSKVWNDTLFSALYDVESSPFLLVPLLKIWMLKSSHLILSLSAEISVNLDFYPEIRLHFLPNSPNGKFKKILKELYEIASSRQQVFIDFQIPSTFHDPHSQLCTDNKLLSTSYEVSSKCVDTQPTFATISVASQT